MPISILNTALALGIVTTGGAAGHAEQPYVNQQHCSHQVQMHQKDHQHRAQVQ